jgi:hypothetical protein
LSESSPEEQASKKDNPKKANAIVGQTFFKNSRLFSNFFFSVGNKTFKIIKSAN